MKHLTAVKNYNIPYADSRDEVIHRSSCNCYEIMWFSKQDDSLKPIVTAMSEINLYECEIISMFLLETNNDKTNYMKHCNY